jgi:hypothetical protein
VNYQTSHAKTLDKYAIGDTVIFIFNDSLGKATLEKVMVSIKINKIFKNRARPIERKELFFEYKCSNAIFWNKNPKKPLPLPSTSTKYKIVCSDEGDKILNEVMSDKTKHRLFIVNESSKKMYEVDMAKVL